MSLPVNVLLVTIPEIGHMTCMLGTARALHSMGHHVYLATFEHMRGMVEKDAPGVHFLTLGSSPLGEGGGDGEVELHRKISDPKTSMLEQMDLLKDILLTSYPAAMFTGLAHHLLSAGLESHVLPCAAAAVRAAAALGAPLVAQAASRQGDGHKALASKALSGSGEFPVTVSATSPFMREAFPKPDVLVFDSATAAGLDVAWCFQLPTVYLNTMAGIGTVLTYNGLQKYNKADHIPADDFGLGVMPAKMTTWQRRVANPAMKWASVKVAEKMFLPVLNKRRKEFGLPKMKHMGESHSGLLDNGFIVVNAISWVLEMERPLPDHWHMVGPVGFDSKNIPAIADSKVAAFLDDALAAGEKVVYVALGTIAFLTARQVSALARSMSPPHAAPGVRYLWSLRPHLMPLLQPQDVPDPTRVMILPWVQQVPVLFHKAVAVFVSHGGMGSTNEGVAASKPILCIPFLGDQPINAQHIVDRGLGLALAPKKMTAKRVGRRVKRLLQERKFAEVSAHLGAKLRAMDGARDAAALIVGMVRY